MNQIYLCLTIKFSLNCYVIQYIYYILIYNECMTYQFKVLIEGPKAKVV